MPYRLVIAAEDPEMAAALSQAAAKLRPHWNCVVLDDYSAVGNLHREIDPGGQPLTAMVVAVSDSERALYLLQAVKQAFPELTTAAAHPAPSSDLILGAMRAGAAEFLTSPYDLAHLAERVEQNALPAGVARSGKLFCFVPAKGASGASTVALHLAQSISRVLDERVLFVDFDFHSGAAAFRLRLKPHHTIVEALERTSEVRELWEQLVTRWKSLDILPAPTSYSSLPPAILNHVPQLFRAAREKYACIVVDLPNSVLASCRDVMMMADCVFLVCTPDVISLHLAKRKLNELLQAGISGDRIEIIVNRVNSGKAPDVADISKLVGKRVYQTFENAYEAVSDASLRGELVKEDSGMGRQFRNFASRILGSPAPPTTGKSKEEKPWSWTSFFSMK